MSRRVLLAGAVGLAGLGAAMVGWYASGPAASPAPEPLFEAPRKGTGTPRSPIRFVSATGRGVEFRHRPHPSAKKYMPETTGSGVAVVDVNRDGAPDLVFVNGGDLASSDPTTRPADARNRLYLNDGAGRFRDRTDAWNLPSRGYGMGVAAGDYNNDGWIDLYLTGLAGAAMLLKNTGERFVEVTSKAGVGTTGWSTSAGFLDMEGDGDLDLYVARYVRYGLEKTIGCYRGNELAYCTPALYEGLPDRLYRNDADGAFTEVGADAGLPASPANGLAVGIGDVNRDGHADIYVANDLTPNHLLIGRGDGTFDSRGELAGVAYGEHGTEQAGMGVAFADVNDDGRTDIACTNFQGETTNLYVQETQLFFHDRSAELGIGQTARARLSFGVELLDADNDTDEDLAVANGHIQSVVGTYSDTTTYPQRNSLYENRGGRFADVSSAAGAPFTERRVSRGLAVGELDGDGRLDLVVNNNGGRGRVALNRTKDAGGFVNLWLEAAGKGRSAIGAVVTATAGEKRIRREVRGASSFLSVSDRRVHLGLGDAEAARDVVIHWPSGARQELGRLEAGRFYRVVSGKQPQAYEPGARVWAPASEL